MSQLVLERPIPRGNFHIKSTGMLEGSFEINPYEIPRSCLVGVAPIFSPPRGTSLKTTNVKFYFGFLYPKMYRNRFRWGPFEAVTLIRKNASLAFLVIATAGQPVKLAHKITKS